MIIIEVMAEVALGLLVMSLITMGVGSILNKEKIVNVSIVIGAVGCSAALVMALMYIGLYSMIM